MKKEFTLQEWLKMFGKDKLQTFQDMFSKQYGLSMVFFDLNGVPLTVWSQDSLFCYEKQKKDDDVCQNQKHLLLSKALKEEKLTFFTCPFGLVGFACPVMFEGKAVAFVYCSGAVNQQNSFDAQEIEDYHLRVMSTKELEFAGHFAEAILNVFNINLKILDRKKAEALAPRESIRDERISEREREIVELICRGCSNKQISEALFISETTVKTHVSNILAKLNLRDRMQIIVHYYGKGVPDEH
ncbi:MAG: LuxR family transcriptional regulator [Acidaminococcaceae bacterium]|nr:LuxR family transcriptional regulator [Acidaminococcaceae bacterium]